MKPIFFPTPTDFYQWLEQNHQKEQELLVGFHKKQTGKTSITWPESVDQALCFGWIDGVRRSIDETAYSIRFTPRKPKSVWSAVNIAKVEELTKTGKMQPAGFAAYAKRQEHTSRIYSFEQDVVQFTPEQEAQFQANEKAWAYFKKRPPSYQKTATWWVISAKQETTKQSRLNTLIKDSHDEKTIKQLTR